MAAAEDPASDIDENKQELKPKDGPKEELYLVEVVVHVSSVTANA
jgi:hypothetical protein